MSEQRKNHTAHRTCNTTSCRKPVYAHGLCSSHYYRQRVGSGEYNATDVCTAVGITYRQLDYWLRHGHITPTADVRAPGSGRHRTFTRGDIEQVRLLAMLVRAGVEPAHARSHIDEGLVVDVDGCPALLLPPAAVYSTEQAS